MNNGEYVAYPSKIDKQIHIGIIEGAYEYNPTVNKDYPHQRKVRWVKALSRTYFSQGALYESGSAMTLFQIKNYADEFITAIEGKPISEPIEDDETVGQVVEKIIENTHVFILKKIERELKGHPFAHFVGHLLEKMGYQTRISPEGPDGGIDIIAHKDELGFEPPIIKVQVKSTSGSSGDPEISQLYGKVAPNEFGLFITLGTFSKHAINFARDKSNLRLIDGDDLIKLVLKHYDKLDSKYKGLIPLKNAYVPEPADE